MGPSSEIALETEAGINVYRGPKYYGELIGMDLNILGATSCLLYKTDLEPRPRAIG